MTHSGKDTAERILDAAISVIVEEGYGALSIRTVAQRASVGIGNLQHYFPTRSDLVRAALSRALEEFEVGVAARGRDQATSPEERMRVAIEVILDEQKRSGSCRLFWELWALAAQDEQIAAAMDGFYRTYVDKVADLVGELRPGIPRARAQRAGAAVTSLLEGASLLRGAGKPRRRYLAGFDDTLHDVIRMIVERA
ncbi:MAG: betI1 [Alphaproteobacteria bacterium]|nr:MAG: betI1 [Caulobacteraceae bacterium]TPW05304.1 MAG: betI1 [Alphaproteobacteria bacterium]